MTEEERLRVTDKRGKQEEAGSTPPVTLTPDEETVGFAEVVPEISLDELKRMKADLENDRKRLIRQHNEQIAYASRDYAKRMIPVLDHFRLALEHGEGGQGIEIAYKELLEVLMSEGLEEIAVNEGDPFDPTIHHALAMQTSDETTVESVLKVHRPGYRFKDHVLRAVEVVVAQPQEMDA